MMIDYDGDRWWWNDDCDDDEMKVMNKDDVTFIKW
jgi:hypothetical protein